MQKKRNLAAIEYNIGIWRSPRCAELNQDDRISLEAREDFSPVDLGELGWGGNL